MPIVTQCPKCSSKMRAPDAQVGKKAKCPKCKNPFLIQPIKTGGGKPSASSSTPAKGVQAKGQTQKPSTPARPHDSLPEQSAIAKPTQPSQPQRPQAKTPSPAKQPQAASQDTGPDAWFVQLADGAEYGPVTHAEMDTWFAEDRIDADCQLLQEGWTQWKWAEDVYPSLAEGSSESNPFAGIGGGSSVVERLSGVHGSGVGKGGGDRNPYASPSTSFADASAPVGEGDVSARMAAAMQGTRPWVFFLSILGFLATGLIVLGMLMSFFIMMHDVLLGILMFVFYGIYAGLTGYPSFLLLKYSQAAGAVAQSHRVSDLETALETQRRYWKMVGIMACVAVGLAILFFVLSLVLGVAAGVAASQAG